MSERWISWKSNEKVCCIGAKTCSYLTDDRDEFRKSKDTKKCLIKRKATQKQLSLSMK